MKNIEFNTQICTTKEQSKRLLELGLDADTSDMCWLAKKLWGDDVEIPEEDRSYILSTDKDDSFCNRYDVDCIPAWSLHRLMEMLPESVWFNGSYHTLEISYVSLCYIDYGHESIAGNFADFNGISGIYDAIINCIKWLIKDGYFNKEYLKEE